MTSSHSVPQSSLDSGIIRRNACDRCRGQKLRCPREEQGIDNPCKRCQKAGAECITNASLPMGRPPLSSKNTGAHALREGRASSVKKRRLTGRLEPKAVSPLNSESESSLLVSQLSVDLQRSRAEPSTNRNSIERITDTNFDSAFGSVHAEQSISAAPPLTTSIIHGSSADDLSSAFISNRDQGQMSDEPIDRYIDDPAGSSREQNLEDNVMQQISLLNLDLYRQLKVMKSDTWWEALEGSAFGSTDLSEMDCAPIERLLANSKVFSNAVDQVFPSLATDSISITTHMPNYTTRSMWTGSPSTIEPDQFTADQSDPLLEDTSFLLNESIPSPFPISISNSSVPSHTTNLSSSSNLPETMRTVDTATLLSMLACYVRVVRVYGYLFSRVHKILAQGCKIPAILPSLSMGGFKLQGDIQMMILAQVCAKLLDKVEQALGLDGLSGGSLTCGPNGSESNGKTSKSLLEIIMRKEEVEGSAKNLKDDMRTVKALLSANLAQDM